MKDVVTDPLRNNLPRRRFVMSIEADCAGADTCTAEQAGLARSAWRIRGRNARHDPARGIRGRAVGGPRDRA